MSDSRTPDGNPGKGEKKEVEVRYVPVEYMDHGHQNEDEISLIDLVKVLWEGRKLIIISVAIFTFIGLFVFLFGQREYESDAILIQEQQQQQGFSGNFLMEQFGGGALNLQGEGIPATLYPDILQSADFLLEVVNHEVEFESLGITTTPLRYFNDLYDPPLTEKIADFLIDYTIKLPVTLYRGVRGLLSRSTDPDLDVEMMATDTRFLSLNREERFALRMIRERIEINVSGRLVTFTVNMPDANAAAELNYFVIDQIQDYVINYRISKYRQNLVFVKNQKEEARKRYEESQLELARFRDQNVSITSAVARTQQEDLQNRRNIMFNVYNNLAQELEQARTRLQEETPVFNVLQKPSLPYEATSGSKVMLILLIFLGLFFGIFLVFGERAWVMIKEQIND